MHAPASIAPPAGSSPISVFSPINTWRFNTQRMQLYTLRRRHSRQCHDTLQSLSCSSLHPYTPRAQPLDGKHDMFHDNTNATEMLTTALPRPASFPCQYGTLPQLWIPVGPQKRNPDIIVSLLQRPIELTAPAEKSTSPRHKQYIWSSVADCANISDPCSK